MNLLSLETSSDACSVALQRDAGIVERHLLRPKEHTQLLVPMIESVLEEAGLVAADLDAIAVGIGPGSFIGVRIGVSVAQGIAYAAGCKVVPVSSLAAIAAESFEASAVRQVIVAQDAHMHQVYLARFARADDGRPTLVGEEILHDIEVITCLPEDGARSVWHAAGKGWQRYPELRTLNEGRLTGSVDVLHPRAYYLLPTAAALLRDGAAIEPQALEPAYLRHRVARENASTPRADGKQARQRPGSAAHGTGERP